MGQVVTRDAITIDGSFANFWLKKVEPGGDPLVLLARSVQHAPGFVFDLGGRKLIIVASTYSGNNGKIVSDGEQGVVGNMGSHGRNAQSTRAGVVEGTSGTRGERGQQGRPGGSVKIVAESIQGLDISAQGGKGGTGGMGGEGGQSVFGHWQETGFPRTPRPLEPAMDPESIVRDGSWTWFPGAFGGVGAWGGDGGIGGPGGEVHIHTLKYTSTPVVNISGGPPGDQGKDASESIGHRPLVADPGPEGQPPFDAANVLPSLDAYWSKAVESIPIASALVDWARHRMAVGDLHHRRFAPSISTTTPLLSLAQEEFRAALAISTELLKLADWTTEQLSAVKALQTESEKRLGNIECNVNAIGYSRRYDLEPDFAAYNQAFTNFGELTLSFLDIASGQYLAAVSTEDFAAFMKVQQGALDSHLKRSMAELIISNNREVVVQDRITRLKVQLLAVKQQIEQVQSEMNSHKVNILGVVKTVAEVAIAIFAVGAAIETGGASLLALGPDAIALGETAVNDVVPLWEAIFHSDETTGENLDLLDDVKDQFGDVSKQIDDIKKGRTAIINLVSAIQQLTKGKTSDNSKYVQLVQQAASLAQELAVEQKELEINTLQSAAIQADIDRVGRLSNQAGTIGASADKQTSTLRQGALVAIRNTQTELDQLIDFAFRTQRSLEIFTLKPEDANVPLDAGRLHPDLEADYRDMVTRLVSPGNVEVLSVDDATMHAGYLESWHRLLAPINMQTDLFRFFDHRDRDVLWRRFSFTEPEILESLRKTHRFARELEPEDFGMDRLEAKAEVLFASFVGARSNSNIIQCQITHGNRYTQLLSSSPAIRSDVYLESHSTVIQCPTTRMEIDGVSNIQVRDPRDATASFSFWGRGVCGRYEVVIPEDEFKLEGVDLEGLVEVQLWVGYSTLI